MRNGHLSSSFHWYRKIIHSHPFEPDKFPSISRLGITLHIGGQRRRQNLLSIYKQSIAWCWKANIEKKMEFQKLWSSPIWEIWVSKSKAKILERNLKKIVKEKWIERKPKEKNGLKSKWRETRKEDQNRIGPSHSEKLCLVWSS